MSAPNSLGTCAKEIIENDGGEYMILGLGGGVYNEGGSGRMRTRFHMAETMGNLEGIRGCLGVGSGAKTNANLPVNGGW